MASVGYVPHHLHGKCFPLPGISRGAIVPSYTCSRDQNQYYGTRGLLKSDTSHSSKRISQTCNVRPSNYKRNFDYTRQQKGSSGGKNKQYQDPEMAENTEEMDFVSSKNGSLLSLTSNSRHQTTTSSGQREKEIVELFRKVQARLRERAAIKEEKKIEATRQGQSERGTVDSLLKLLRKHSMNQKKNSSPEADFSTDQLEKSNTFEDEQNFDIFSSEDVKLEESTDSASSFTRPASNFRRKSPVPVMKFQPVFSVDQDIDSPPSKSRGRRKKASNNETGPAAQADPMAIVLVGQDELSLVDQLGTSSSHETAEETKELSDAEVSSDLGSLKFSELRELAKSRGIKGYSKLKKGELVELLSS